MKKLFTVLLVVAMIFGLYGCKNEDGNRITELLEQGYKLDTTGGEYEDYRIGMKLSEGEEMKDYIIIRCILTDKKEKELEKLDFFSESYWDDAAEIYQTLEVTGEVNCMQFIPSDEEINGYVGKTINDLMEEGFTEWGNFFAEDSAQYQFDNEVYMINITLDSNLNMNNVDDYSPNEINAMAIATAEFMGLSSNIAFKDFD